MRNFELVVIGGGPAGITLAKRLGKIYDMAIIRPEDYSMIYCAMPYVLENVINKEKTFKKDALVTDNGAELIRDSVVKVDDKANTLTLKSGKVIGFQKLVIATGAEPVIPPIPGADLEGVFGFKTQEDLESLLKLKEHGLKKAVIVGAGAIGVELAQALNTASLEVHLVDMEKTILPNMIDSEMSEEAQADMISSGIHLHMNEKITAIKGKEYAYGVEFESGKTIDFSITDENCVADKEEILPCIVVFAVGVKPTLDFISETSIKTGKGGIVVDAAMNTNVDNIFACGDAVEFKSAITGKVYPGKLATNAVPMARILSENLKGNKKEYAGFYNGAATKVHGHYLGGTGLTEKAAVSEGYKVIIGTAETTTTFPIMPEAKKIRVKLVGDADSGRILGGQIVSGEPVTGRIDVLTLALQNKMTAENLVELSYSAQPYQSFFPAGNVIVMAAEIINNKIKEKKGASDIYEYSF